MGWVFVFSAAFCELAGVVGLNRFTERKTLQNGLWFICGFAASFALLYASFQHLQLSVAYTVWVGLGTSLAVIVNMLFFGESRSPLRLFSLALIIVGVTGLKAVSG
ncbi:DMT family transporter [Paenibacillus pasadenensis]|uniref:Quaternary ammonium compound-resistance protein SugE n=1 Tax=Paenibacillus pasadenensis TaxID=217090 RepID=A0A2N5NAC4_9BACL|nr:MULTISPECIES: multidrug efflux SMR transporter [Paenibacillus]PLT47258.1 Quaternary ammonium compound-resistance protein SugE [Paenibacillus pasadenensis]QGG57563.1 QacE family quaternary ammonium compound efflux SMR transporter [Paenibacillus sp. B01]